MPKLFGREIPAWIALASSAVYLLGAFVFHLSGGAESLLIAAIAAVAGVYVAVKVHDGASAAVYGLAKALLTLAVGFGLHLAADQQAVLLSFVAAAIAMFTRTQATAPVAAGPAAQG